MSFVLVIIFTTRFLLSRKIDLTKVPLGKMLALYGKGFLDLFLRTKTLLKGGSNGHDKGQPRTRRETIPVYGRARPSSRVQGTALEHD